MNVDEKVFDRCLGNILDCISDHKLQELGIESIDELFDREWLVEWFKHGCPTNKKSHLSIITPMEPPVIT